MGNGGTTKNPEGLQLTTTQTRQGCGVLVSAS